MALLFTIFFYFLLNVPALICIIAGIIFIKDKVLVVGISLKLLRIFGVVLVVLGLILIIHGILTGYGLQ